MGAGASSKRGGNRPPEPSPRQPAQPSAGAHEDVAKALASAEARVQQLLAELERLSGSHHRSDGGVQLGASLAPPPQAEQAPKPKPSLLHQLSGHDTAGVQGDLRQELELRGSLTREQIGEFLRTKGGEWMDEDAIDELFTACDFNGDGNVDMNEFEQAMQLMCPTASPESYLEEMLSSAGVPQLLVSALLNAAQESGGEDPSQAILDFSAARFVGAIDSVKGQLADALVAHCAKVRAMRTAEGGTDAGSNAKFAAQGAFEGAYGDLDDFLAGVDAIGLPQPRTFQGMENDFTRSEDSDLKWETSNYGGITTTPRLEWEYVVCPDLGKTYPGGRVGVNIEVFCYAVAAEGEQGKFQQPLDAAGLGEGERAAVEVAVLRRCKAQLDAGFLRSVLQQPVDQAQVDAIISVLEEALAEHPGAADPVLAGPARSETKSGLLYLALCQRVHARFEAIGWKKSELARLIEMERDRLRPARLTREELIAVRLYTGPPFMKFNTVLRMSGGSLPAAMTAHLRGNKYVTSIHTCVSGMIKLSTVSCIPGGRVVYRGMTGMRLPKKFWVANQWRARGGVEFGFLSTTTKRKVAIQYINAGQAVPTIFEIEVGMIDKGGSVSFLSQFPGEDEVLMPPRSNIEVTGKPHLVATEKGKVLVIPARINANLKVKTIEETQAQRKNLHMSLLGNVVREVKRDISEITASPGFAARKEMDPTKRSVDRFVDSVIEECDTVLHMHDRKPVDWFNIDSNYDKVLGEAIILKSHAMVNC